MVNAGRAFKRWVLGPPFPRTNSYREPATRDSLWLKIGLRTEIPEHGRQLFTGTLQQRNRVWREFRNYARQAKTYDDSARRVKGSSAALLHYYVALNLAKAELLISRQSAIMGTVIRHGLSYRPTAAQTISGDFLTVQDGVFPLLYEKRTGVTLPTGTRLPIKRLLASCLEIGWEYETLGLGESRVGSALHAMGFDDQQAWSLFAIDRTLCIDDQSVTARLFRRHYEEISQPEEWRDKFAVSRRFFAGRFRFFESRRSHPIAYSPQGDILPPGLIPVLDNVWNALHLIIDEPTVEAYDVFLCPSLFKSRMLPMPASLARYALMFYVSSLVRYKPSQLDPQTYARQAWILDSFTDLAAPLLIRAALSGIEQVPHVYFSEEAFRL